MGTWVNRVLFRGTGAIQKSFRKHGTDPNFTLMDHRDGPVSLPAGADPSMKMYRMNILRTKDFRITKT